MRPTKSFQAVSPTARFRTLPGNLTVYDLADRCRTAGLEILAGARAGNWDRMDIGRWLLKSYAVATIPATNTIVELRRKAGGGLLDASDVAITRLLDQTRAHVVERLRNCTRSWEAAGFARDMVEGGFVVGVADAYDAIGYAPVDDRSMRLADRVASLFVADYLTRPRDYESLVVCESCGEVSFSWAEVHDPHCARTPRSGIHLRGFADRRSTRHGLGG